MAQVERYGRIVFSRYELRTVVPINILVGQFDRALQDKRGSFPVPTGNVTTAHVNAEQVLYITEYEPEMF